MCGVGEVLASLPEAGVLVTGGEVKVGLCWGVDGEGRLMCPPGLESGDLTEPYPNTANLASLKKWAGTLAAAIPQAEPSRPLSY